MEKIGTIKISGKQISIFQVNDPELAGESNSTECWIKINKNLPNDHKESIKLHEIIHIASDYAGLNLTEKQVLGLESILFPIVKVKTRKARVKKNDN